jgi:hypothetical protein
MKRASFLSFLLGLLTLLSLNLLVQAAGQNTQAPRGASKIVIPTLSISTIPNAPFTATLRIEWVRKLEDGSFLLWKSHELVARDSNGRTFREFRKFASDGDTRETPLYMLKYCNPATHEMYTCGPQGRTCRLSPYHEPPPEVVVSLQRNNDRVTRVSLGNSLISGVETVGSKESTIVSADEAATDRPITTTREFWYSRELGIDIVLKRYDPRVGSQNFLVDNLIVGEPNPSLFEVPAGATIVRDTVHPPDEP